MPSLALPYRYHDPTYLIQAIKLPPSCLRVTFPALQSSGHGSHTRSPAANNAPISLETLSIEILLTIVDTLSITSRVHLALTGKRLARILVEARNVLTLDVRNLGQHTVRLLRDDESFQCWSIDTRGWTPYPQYYHSNRPELMTLGRNHFDLRCNECNKRIQEPELRTAVESVLGASLESAYEASGASSLSSFLALHSADINQLYEQGCRNCRKEVFEHTLDYVSTGAGGRIFTMGMFKLMDVYMREKVREQNIKWAKEAVVSWVIAGIIGMTRYE